MPLLNFQNAVDECCGVAFRMKWITSLFMLNDGILRRERHGQKADGNYVIKDETI